MYTLWNWYINPKTPLVSSLQYMLPFLNAAIFAGVHFLGDTRYLLMTINIFLCIFWRKNTSILLFEKESFNLTCGWKWHIPNTSCQLCVYLMWYLWVVNSGYHILIMWIFLPYLCTCTLYNILYFILCLFVVVWTHRL